MSPMFPRDRADTERVLKAARELANSEKENTSPYTYSPQGIAADLLQIIREREEQLDLLLIEAAEKRRDRWHATYNAALQQIPLRVAVNTADLAVTLQAHHILARDQANTAHGSLEPVSAR